MENLHLLTTRFYRRFRNVTRSGKYEFRTSNTNSFTRLFAYLLAPRRAKKHACGRLQKERLSI